MTSPSSTNITAWGYYLPEKILTNADLETMVETTDEWIVTRTGMRERHIAQPNQFASHLGIAAVENLIARNQVSVDDVDTIIATTFTPDHFAPAVSALIQGHFKMKDAATFDLGAGCTGFAYALHVADALITCGKSKKLLIVAAESISKIVDYEDRATCILFGDAGAACLLERTEGKGSFIASHFSTDGDQAASVTCGNQSNTVCGQSIPQHILQQNGQHVYKYVMQNIPHGIGRLLEKSDLAMDDIDWFVPHSANMRIVEMVCKKLGFPLEKTPVSMEYCGNTSSASIPLAICLALEEDRIKPGDTLLVYGFGAGLTHGGVTLRP